MIEIVTGANGGSELLAGMFRDRKRLFVDVLGWELAVRDGAHEVDQFDRPDANYLIALEHGAHAGSMRLLPTERPHILGALFPELCDSRVPTGPDIFEITRLCLPTRYRAPERLAIRNRLISAMVDHALDAGIKSFTGVTDANFLEQVLAMGWRSAALGYPRRIGAQRIGAFRIEIDPDTPERLAGIYLPGTLAHAAPVRAAA